MATIIYGIHVVKALFEKSPERFIEIWILKDKTDNRLVPFLADIADCKIPLQYTSRKVLDELTDGVHQGVVARIKERKPYQEGDLAELLERHSFPFLLILDGVTDPHNLGACLRSADAAGVHAVIVPRDHAASLTAVAKKVACGAAEHVPFIKVTNLARTLRLLKQYNISIIGTSDKASQTLYQVDLSGAVAIVMGAEDKGIRRLTREHCDVLVNIPMAGSVSSLNVSVAAGVCLFEAVRQHNSNW